MRVIATVIIGGCAALSALIVWDKLTSNSQGYPWWSPLGLAGIALASYVMAWVFVPFVTRRLAQERNRLLE